MVDAVKKGDSSAFDGCVAVVGEASAETISAQDFILTFLLLGVSTLVIVLRAVRGKREGEG